MGYRSKVTAIIYGSPDKMDALIAKHELLGTSPMQHFKDNIRQGRLPKSTRHVAVLELTGEDWKWYESYPDVQCWMSFMHSAEDMGLEYEFVRIGENDDDVERQGSADNEYLLYCIRDIGQDYDIITEENDE